MKIIGNYRRIRKGKKYMSKKQAMNPYLPLWEYVPDGEPRVLVTGYMYMEVMTRQGQNSFVWEIMLFGVPQ